MADHDDIWDQALQEAYASAPTDEGTIIIQPGGARVSDPPADSFVIGDDDIWSF